VDAVGVIGLGIMGGAYAANLRAAGFEVWGCDPSEERLAMLAALGGKTCSSPADVAANANRIIISLPSGAALQNVTQGLVTAVAVGSIIVETSTLCLADKQQAAATLGPDVILLDCPVSGTGAQAHSADLVVFGSGDERAFDACADIFDAISRKRSFLGLFGNGMRMKLVANHLVTIHNAAAGEAFAMAIKAGIAPSVVYDTLVESAGSSRMFQVRGPLMVEDLYDEVTATVRTHLKDLGLIEDLAASLEMPLPLFDTASRAYREAEAVGFADLDTAVVCRISERRGGVTRKGRRG
jgi:putative dehydrogenase